MKFAPRCASRWVVIDRPCRRTPAERLGSFRWRLRPQSGREVSARQQAAEREKLREKAVLVNTIFENKVDQLRDMVKRLDGALSKAGIRYQVIGGLAVFCHVDGIDPLAARLTRDVDVAIDKHDLQRIADAVKPIGLVYRHVAGIDMLVEAAAPKARSAVHMVFVNEKVRPTDPEPIPGFSEPTRTTEGFFIAPVADLVRMKLTSFRLKDKVHIQDMDSVGLITPEIENGLPAVLRGRLKEVRATE